MNKDDFQKLSYFRDRGMVPDLFWYQLNGKSPQENFEEQRNNIYEQINYGDTNEPMNIKVTCESKVKK